MKPKPESKGREYRAANKLEPKVALITGGDSGIGRAVAVAFAKEGADVAIVYLEEHEDARENETVGQAEGRRCILISGDVGDEEFCNSVVEETVKKLQRAEHSHLSRGPHRKVWSESTHESCRTARRMCAIVRISC